MHKDNQNNWIPLLDYAVNLRRRDRKREGGSEKREEGGCSSEKYNIIIVYVMNNKYNSWVNKHTQNRPHAHALSQAHLKPMPHHKVYRRKCNIGTVLQPKITNVSGIL